MKFKSRKQARKEFRKSKKIKKHEFFSRKKPKTKNESLKTTKFNPSNLDKSFNSVVNNSKKPNQKNTIAIEKTLDNKRKKKPNSTKSTQERFEYERQKEKMELEKLNRDIRNNKLKMLKSDNKKEDIEIKKLEKQLKINKRPSKAFALDGLDYLLDVCDKKISENEYEKNLIDSDSEFESDFENIVGKTKESNLKESQLKKKNNLQKQKVIKNKENKKKFRNDSNSDSNSDLEDDDFDNNSNLDTDEDGDAGFDDEDIEMDSEFDGTDSNDYVDDELDNDTEDHYNNDEGDGVELDSESEDDNDSNIESDSDEDILDGHLKNQSKNLGSNDKIKKHKLKKGDSQTVLHQEDSDEYSVEDSEIGEDMSKKSSKKNFKKRQMDEKMENECNKKIKTKKIKNKKGTSEPLGKIDEDASEDEEIKSLEQMDRKAKSQKEQKLREDIYGRTRDEQGNIISTYVPPQLRNKIGAEETDKKSEKLLRLKKQIKGLLNRLSESNMHFISNQVEQLYMSNSRNHMNETLFTLFQDSLFTEVLTPERLIAEHAMLVAVLYSNTGSEIGAHFLQHSVNEFCKKLESDPEVENKEINNILIFIMHLYNFQIFHSKLMYDLIYLLLKKLEEKQIELLLTSLRIVGFCLRKDDPAALKNLVLEVQKQVNMISTPELSSRVKFMLDMLMAIKNNNMSKIPNYDPEFVEKLRKSLKQLIRKGNYISELNISLQDLLNAEKHGRWWIVGSAWSGGAPGQPDSSKPKEIESSISNEFSQKLLDLAKQQRMNTDARRNIFCILMSAEDYLDAFEKLIKLKLKGTVEREIMNVLFHCALQERNFNPYYVYLANKFCTFDRKYQIMIQCALWDRIKELQSLLPIQITNLAKFVGNVILERGLPISVLKVIQFSDLHKPTIKFMRQVLLTILCHEDENAIAAVFKRIADSSQLKIFRESLRLFLQHFVLKNTKNVEKEKVTKLVDMVRIAEQALTSTDVKMVF